MKICLSCSKRFKSCEWVCPICGFVPKKIDGLLAFAPELDGMCEAFPVESFQDLFDAEARNFWFCSRNRLIIWCLKNYFPNVLRFLEIGCGTGFVLTGIEKMFPNVSLSGSEIHLKGLDYAAKRLKKAFLFQMDARRIPFDEESDRHLRCPGAYPRG